MKSALLLALATTLALFVAVSAAPAAVEPWVCQLPVVSGPCEAYMPSYYFDSKAGVCKSFIYGGCKGNANRFSSLEACQANCPSICSLPPVSGPCKALFRRFHYVPSTGTCESFVFGGCEGNDNNFGSAEECANTCIPPVTRSAAEVLARVVV